MVNEDQIMVNNFIQKASQEIRRHLSQEKKNIILLAHYDTYRGHFGRLAEYLRQKYQVIIVIGDKIRGDMFEKSAEATVYFPYRLRGQSGEIIYLNADIEGIDLIITTDEISYDNGIIDREFLSKSAVRMYLPHSLIEQTGAGLPVDYIAVPSSLSMDSFKEAHCKARLIPCGYPKLDKSLSEYYYTDRHTLTYAPTLHYTTKDLVGNNAIIGFSNNLIEWLIENTNYHISYRTHPIAFLNHHLSFDLITKKWQNNPRVSFDTQINSDFYNWSDFLITDSSTSAFSYAFTTLHPAFFFAPFKCDNKILANASKIGGIARNFAELDSLIQSYKTQDYKEKIREFRDSVVYNLGNSCENIVKGIDKILAHK